MSTKVDVASNDDCSGGILPGEAVSFYEPNGLSGCDEPRLVDTILSRPPARGLDGWDLVMAELRSAGFDNSVLTSRSLRLAGLTTMRMLTSLREVVDTAP